jgi:ribosomal protein S10
MNKKLVFTVKAVSKNSLFSFENFFCVQMSKLKIEYSVVHLPRVVKKFTLLRSPHVYKKSKEQYAFINYKTVFIFDRDVNIDVLKLLLKNTPKTLFFTLSII